MNTNIRHSHQRDMIYDYIMSTKEHPTAETIYVALKSREKSLSLGTVYRNLKLLESLGKVQRVTTVDNTERYDGNITNHAHFICERCGAIIDLDNIDLKSIHSLVTGHTADNSIGSVNITAKGICSKCQNNEQR